MKQIKMLLSKEKYRKVHWASAISSKVFPSELAAYALISSVPPPASTIQTPSPFWIVGHQSM